MGICIECFHCGRGLFLLLASNWERFAVDEKLQVFNPPLKMNG